MTTGDEATHARVARTGAWILIGYCVLVFGGLAGVAGLFWWVCLNC